MMRQLTDMIVQLLGKHRLERLSGTFVQSFALFPQHRVVRNFLGQCVLEDKLALRQRRCS
jgi:hypothetical protein